MSAETSAAKVIEQARLVRSARCRVHDVAHELAQQGLSPETIRAAMLDMANSASLAAAAFIARYDAAEARAEEDDRADVDDERQARADREEAAQ